MEAIRLDEPLDSEQLSDITSLHYGWSEHQRTVWPALRSGCDAVHSKIAQSHPRPIFLTTDGDWDLQNQAEYATMWMDGEFSRAEIDQLGEQCFDDALTFGSGICWVGEQHDQPHYERCWVGDMYVDPREEYYNAVRSIYRVRYMDCGVLMGLYPSQKKEIEKARGKLTASVSSALGHDVGIADTVECYEAWRLRDGPEATGRATIAIDGATLTDDRKWEGERFPFAKCDWSRSRRRYFGIGLVEQMLAPQAELNNIAEINRESRHLFVPILVAEQDSLTVEQLTNEVGRMYSVKPGGLTSGAPQVLHSTPMFLQMAQMEEVYISRVWKLAGISDMSVMSEKAPGVESGTAIRNLADLESERFAIANRSWERLFVDIAKLGYKVAQKIAKGDADRARKLKVLGGKDSLEAIEFSTADMGDSPYRIDVFPVSQLSNTVAAKIDEVMAMVNAQLIDDPQDARDLMDLPDLKRHNNVTSAGRKNVQKVIDKALKKGVATPVDPYMPLPYLIRYGSLMCNLAAMQGAPDSHVQCLRDMVQQAIDLKTEMAAAVAPPAPPALPGAPPMPPGPPGGPMPPDPMGQPPMGPPPLAVVPPGM